MDRDLMVAKSVKLLKKKEVHYEGDYGFQKV
jgi:hypothetical protein